MSYYLYLLYVYIETLELHSQSSCLFNSLHCKAYKDPWQLFKLVWIDELIDRLVKHTNKNAKLHPPPEDKDFPYRWKPTLRQELYAYLAVLIYMGLHIESSIEDYWRPNFNYGTMHVIRNFISANRWQ